MTLDILVWKCTCFDRKPIFPVGKLSKVLKVHCLQKCQNCVLSAISPFQPVLKRTWLKDQNLWLMKCCNKCFSCYDCCRSCAECAFQCHSLEKGHKLYKTFVKMWLTELNMNLYNLTLHITAVLEVCG